MKKLLTFALAMLMCVVIVGTSLAEYGYTKLSQIPAAVDFTFDVTFDEEGLPHIVTDYPYKETGAEELNLTYNKDDIREAAVLNTEYTEEGIAVEAVVPAELFGRVKAYIPGYVEPKEDWE